MLFKFTRIFLSLFCVILLLAAQMAVPAQTTMQATKPEESETLARYLDLQNGMTADEAVTYALAHNGELEALRQEAEAARSLVKQAGLRPNPKLEVSGAKQIGGADNNEMVQGMLPLELGGRRAARIAVAQRELEIREFAVADRERLLAVEVRMKFGETLAQIKKLALVEELLVILKQNLELIAASVKEGKVAPLEENMFLVEVNRLLSSRETAEGKVEVAMLELRNLIGKKSEEPLHLRGDFSNLLVTLPPVEEAAARALRQRSDLQGARTVEQLAVARIEQARAEGRINASLTAGYQRMDSSFPVSGITNTGALRPVQDVFHFFTFGIEIDLPVRNRNQGMIEAAIFEQEAAKRRIEFGELTIRREVASAFARYNRAVRALTIFQSGVRDQAKENLNVVWQTYEFGSKTLLDYIAEERRFLEVENDLVDAELEVYLAGVEILRATNAPELIKK
jgi:outer membrane protein, heavy metal efflux system